MFNKSVEGVLKTFTKAIDDLNNINEARTREIGELNTKLVTAQSEKDKSKRVLDKLQDLIE